MESSRNLNIIPFIVGEDHISTAEHWGELIKELELELKFLE